MKKEIFACCLILALFAGALVNIHCINNLTGEMIALVQQASQYAENEQWQLAEQSALQAEKLWSSKDAYTHIVMPHSEIETAADTFYEFMKEIYSQNAGGVKGAAKAVTAHLQDIADRENLSFGSIF